MAAGTPLALADINNMIGSIVNQLDYNFDRIEEFKAWLDTVGGTGLENTYGMSSGDAAVVVSAFGDLDNLRKIYQGTATQGSDYDFRTFVKQLWGTGVH